ncbi:MAG: 2-hydroxyglutaryl-CoA dehydratase [Deltaproteobacteria bacterium RBG_13_52_11]|nr:MAG: 2-hydroxyglutaryl-CoA dehydratase [Deltaproteobacteria bacterium RBG_13_52_11]
MKRGDGQKVGLTTTIPVEIVFAAGKVPVDLNNRFITNPQKESFLAKAEAIGFPRNTCGWIKGIYGVTLAEGITEMVAVTQGDCSNTHALMEVLQTAGVRIFPFAYPYDQDRHLLALQIERMMEHFGVTQEEVREAKETLDRVRGKVHEIDRLTWQEGVVTGNENHLFLVSTSDMNGDWQAFEGEADRFLAEATGRRPLADGVRLGYLGVPPIFTDLYDCLEELGGRVVFNELQRQFSMPFTTDDIVEQYRQFTYPYSFFIRLEDIKEEIRRRGIDGLIHYCQSFCFRQVQDIILRQEIKLPILTIEGDRPAPVDARTRLRLESFVEMLRYRGQGWIYG